MDKNFKILIINGVNLQQLGTREVNIYGHLSFEEYLKELVKEYPTITIDYTQANLEGALAEAISNADGYDGIVLNPGAYTHTSISIADAVRAAKCPVIEVHISNILNRETFRCHSMTASACIGTIAGFGLDSYRLAIEHFIKKLRYLKPCNKKTVNNICINEKNI